MYHINRKDLMTLEEYAEQRPQYRERIIVHKKNRRVALGPNATLYFEDRLTMLYQVQEILRIEKVFERNAIEEELEVYNPLVPDGTNWKVTFMIEYEDEAERKVALSKLIGIERQVWVQVGDCTRVNPIANEDLVRETENKTSAVHFLRFELTAQMIEAAKNGAAITVGVNHPQYTHETGPLPKIIAESLVSDLDLSH